MNNLVHLFKKYVFILHNEYYNNYFNNTHF
jgi:hypothetical protein